MQVKTAKDIGALVRDRRARLAWSQETLAMRVGVSRLWILQLEKGKPAAQMSLVLRTLKELGFVLDASIPSGLPADGSPSTGTSVIDLDKIIEDAGRVKR